MLREEEGRDRCWGGDAEHFLGVQGWSGALSRQGGAERAVVMGNTGLECQAQEPGLLSCAVEQKRNIAEVVWRAGGWGVFGKPGQKDED